MNASELYQKLNERIPPELSCEWDNDGLMCCPDPGREIRKVLVALDVTEKIAEEAIGGGYDLIVSHHPLIFHPLRALDPGDPVAKKTMKLIRAGVAVMSFHTRLDAVSGGVNDTLAGALGLRGTEPFGEEKIGRIGSLPSPMTLADFVDRVKKITGVPAVLAADAGTPVSRVALLGGNGSDDVPAARSAGADTYLSGEIAHHHLTDAPERGMNLIAAGHFHTENPVCAVLERMILEADASLSVRVTDSNPIRML